MKKSPTVNVISIYFNRENNVMESIQSLLDQTYENLEITIVDDYSRDNTFDRLTEAVGKDSRVKLLRNRTNKGFTKTLIDTIHSSTSKYIAIHGAGDISLSSRIKEQVEYLEENQDVGVLTTDITNIRKPKFNKKEITLNDLLLQNRITHGSVMFRKDIYERVGGYRDFFTSRQDKDLWFRMSLETSIHFLNKKLYTLTTIQNSVSKKSNSSPLPTLLSSFAIHLIKERIRTGEDSLDSYGAQSGLLFKPAKSNALFLKLILVEMRQFNLCGCKGYADSIWKNNSVLIKMLFLPIYYSIIFLNKVKNKC